MSALVETVKELFPLLRGRSGVETLTRTVPVVLRLYRGNVRVLTRRRKAQCRLSGNTAYVGTRPIFVDYANIGDMITGASIAFDYPFIDRIEANITMEPMDIGLSGEIQISPDGEAILTVDEAVSVQPEREQK